MCFSEAGWKVKANDRAYHQLPEFQKKIFLCIKKSRYSVSPAVPKPATLLGLTQTKPLHQNLENLSDYRGFRPPSLWAIGLSPEAFNSQDSGLFALDRCHVRRWTFGQDWAPEFQRTDFLYFTPFIFPSTLTSHPHSMMLSPSCYSVNEQLVFTRCKI